MNNEDHPQGLSPQERVEWHYLCKRLFYLYKKIPQGDTTRKVIAGADEETGENILMFFKGDMEDFVNIRKALK